MKCCSFSTSAMFVLDGEEGLRTRTLNSSQPAWMQKHRHCPNVFRRSRPQARESESARTRTKPQVEIYENTKLPSSVAARGWRRCPGNVVGRGRRLRRASASQET